MAEKRGSIAFFSTYRPPVPLDIYSTPVPPKSKHDEFRMTDGLSSNYNGQMIPPAALKPILNTGKLLGSQANKCAVDSAMIFVSDREHSLETLHLALRFNNQPKVQIFNFTAVYGTFSDVRMEDSGSIAGGYLIYVSTQEDPNDRRQPWTAVYKTNLNTGETDRLTPSWHADLNPAVSPSGDKLAVASFQLKGGWHGEIEDLQTDIYVTNLVKPFKRKLVVEKGGWPTWGSDNVIFFHRMVGKFWSVFRADISSGDIIRVTPDGIDAMTPAALSDTKVAVATMREKREKLESMDIEREEKHYRHIEIFDLCALQHPMKITQKTRPKADHFNPFVIDGGNRIGYHRCNCDLLTIDDEETPRKFHKLKSPNSDVGLFRVSGVFPAFSSDGSKLAFVDNELRTLWVVQKEQKPRIIYQELDENVMFSPVWNHKKDILYICKGPAFSADTAVDICAIFGASKVKDEQAPLITLTDQALLSNNAFPSSSPDGKRLVFRSTRYGTDESHKNLFIMDALEGEYKKSAGKTKRLTEGKWTDTHCQWSPTGDWIVFSSTRDKPQCAPDKDNDLDPGYFAVYLVNVNNKSVVVRVIGSGYDIAGHVNHPFFSPDGKSIAVTSDLAAVSVDPISLPFFLHSVRPYGDIFVVDIDPNNIEKNNDVKKFTRITHSRYENSTPSWTMMPTHNLDETWNLHLEESNTPSCPYADSHGAESWRMTGHLCIPKRCC